MASNGVNRQNAFLSAESVLREAETLIATTAPFDPYQSTKFTSSCTDGYCRNLAADAWKTMAWNIDSGSGASRQSSLALSTDRHAKAPRYVIELIEPPVWQDGEGCTIALYRVFAAGWGMDGSETLLQSHVRFSPKVCR